MQPGGGRRRATAMFNARIARSYFIRLLMAQPITRREYRSMMPPNLTDTVASTMGFSLTESCKDALATLDSLGLCLMQARSFPPSEDFATGHPDLRPLFLIGHALDRIDGLLHPTRCFGPGRLDGRLRP